jgi:hypothetical protein
LGSCGVVLDASNGAALARSLDDAKKRLKETAGGTPTDGVHSADALFRGVATRAMSEAQVSLFVYLFIISSVWAIRLTSCFLVYSTASRAALRRATAAGTDTTA